MKHLSKLIEESAKGISQGTKTSVGIGLGAGLGAIGGSYAYNHKEDISNKLSQWKDNIFGKEPEPELSWYEKMVNYLKDTNNIISEKVDNYIDNLTKYSH